ncbi:MAG: ABC transporter permease [Pyrinomonadaceae bacterium]|nr:ABC transporter permease [Pyrinomonadaceae bacterium]
MTSLLQDARYAARALAKRPAFTFVAVLTLALGIGANTAIFSVVNTVLLRPLPYPEADRLMMLSERHEQIPTRFISYPNFLDWRTHNQVFEAMSTIRGLSLTLTGTGEPESLDGRMVSSDYFSIMRASPSLGRDFLAEEDKPGAAGVTILSHGFWQRQFGGDANVLGRTITLDDKSFTVIGVMPQSFRHQGTPDLFVLMGQWTNQNNWMGRDVRLAGFVVARLKAGVTLEGARADMDAISKQLLQQHPIANLGHSIRVVSLYENIVGDARPALLIMLGAVGLVLLIACANVANLLLARAANRQKEFALRTALGASRWRIVRQLLTESVMLAFLGGGAGLLFAWWGVDLLAAAEPRGVPRLAELGVDNRALVFTFLLSLLTGIVFGLAPAWHISGRGLHQTLKEGSRAVSTGRGGKLRRALVVAEVALAMVLLGGAGLLIKSFARLLASDPGFEAKNVVTAEIGLPRLRYSDAGQVSRFYQQLLERLEALPGVEAATITNSLPGLGQEWQTDIAIKGRPRAKTDDLINVDWAIISSDYFITMKVPLAEGRAFTPQEARDGLPVVVVDERLARQFWPNGDALGKHILYDSATPHEIVGIARNMKTYGTVADARIKIYTPLGRADLKRATLAIRTTNTHSQGIITAATREINALDKDLPVTDVETMERILAREVSPQRFNTLLLTVFASVALMLAAVGIYGVMSYMVAQRTHEIGIRMALGAQRSDVLRLVMGQGLRMTVAGVAAGLLACFALTRVMANLLFGVSATDPATFIIISLLLAGVALIACYVPARRATKVDPMIALRYE